MFLKYDVFCFVKFNSSLILTEDWRMFVTDKYDSELELHCAYSILTLL